MIQRSGTQDHEITSLIPKIIQAPDLVIKPPFTALPEFTKWFGNFLIFGEYWVKIWPIRNPNFTILKQTGHLAIFPKIK